MARTPLTAFFNRPFQIPLVLCSLALALGACSAPPKGPLNEASPWRVLADEHLTIHYAAGAKPDAVQIQNWIASGRQQVLKELQEETTGLLAYSALNVYLHPRPTDQANVGTAMLQTQRDGTNLLAELHLLTPSAYRHSGTTVMGEPYDKAYLFKVVVHEYATLVLDQLTHRKPTGWRFFEAPPWFVQGYEEYLGLFCSSAHSRHVTAARYRESVQQHPERVLLLRGTEGARLEVENPYVEGAVLLMFLYEEFGGSRMRTLLISPIRPFSQALERELGMTPEAMFKAWQVWLKAASG